MLRRLALAFTNCASCRTAADAAAVRHVLLYVFVLPSCTPLALRSTCLQGAWGATGGLASSLAAQRHSGKYLGEVACIRPITLHTAA